ncbi:MAG: 2-hydroxyacyl-CoA dehydratase [Candidatus Tectomicrobia bacterium]|uniref:2-hydroxyacyl-CoA dehydratase n=1 Tax=Tectimicrobiota bacterium TaxID=2528274 RepID=A0A932CS01_UNCTE|nr:2-hydroxyacyl-CoA dehydratase [Candidatus Tectomicrobia bacterium]
MSNGADVAEDLRLETTVRKFTERLKWQEDHGRSLSKQAYTRVMRDYFQRAASAREIGKPLAFTSVLFFPEVLQCMDIVNFAPAQYCIQMMVQGYSSMYLDKGLARGVSPELCSCNIATVGMAGDGIFPTPDLMLATAQQPCDPQAQETELIHNIYQVPIFWFNYPYRTDQETIRYLQREFRDMIGFLEAQTGHKFSEDALQERLEIAKTCHDLFLEVQEMRFKTPCPLGLRDAYQSASVRTFIEGHQDTVDVFRAQHQEVKALVDQGKGAIPNERYRVVAGGVFPFWNMRLFDWMEKEFGAIVVIDFRNRLQMNRIGDTSDPVACLADKIVNCFPLGRTQCLPNPEIAEEGALVAKQANCNASIYFTHFGCKITCGAQRVTTDCLKEIAGINTLVVDVDAYDPRVVSESQIKDRVSQYFEMLDKMGV